jgi:hypothetical protein
MGGSGCPHVLLATITLSCGGNSVKRIYQFHWTGTSSPSRISSRVFTHSVSVEQISWSAERGRSRRTWFARRNTEYKQHPRRIAPAWSGREGVFLFLGGA